MIGDVLKKTREELGLDLRAIAGSLRIQHSYLKSLEDNSLEKLPADVYTKGYIREYARFLNIDPVPLLNEYSEYLEKKSVAAQPETPPPRKNFFLRPVVLLIPIFVLIVAALAAHFGKTSGPANENKVSALSIPAPVAVEVKIPQQKAVQPQHILNITATDTTWLRVEYGQGKSEELLMKPGEAKQWASGDGFSLRVGNAGGVKVVLNDRDMGVLGEKGKVLNLRLP